MTDVKEAARILKACVDENRNWVTAVDLADPINTVLAALSGTREAVEPVAWAMYHNGKIVTTIHDASLVEIVREANQNCTFVPLAPITAAPPSDPVGQGAVTAALKQAAQIAGDACWSRPMPKEWDRDKEAYVNWCADQSKFVREKILALSPAPEAGSDEVERLRARAKKSWNDLQLVWDGILGNRPRCRDCADEDGVCPHSKLPCDPTEAAVAKALIWKNDVERLTCDLERKHEAYCIAHDQAMENGVALRNAEARETALRDQLGKMREAEAEAGQFPRTYDTEYGGRSYTHCTACDATLSEGEPHADDCGWVKIDATLAETQEAGR